MECEILVFGCIFHVLLVVFGSSSMGRGFGCVNLKWFE